MRRFVNVVLTVAVLGGAASMAQASVEDPRMQAIWDSAYNRMSNQVDIWYDAGDFPRCAQLLRLQAEVFPQDYNVATNLGYMLQSMDLYAEELAVYINFRRDNPEDPDASFPEAWFYMLRRAYAKIPPLLEPTLKKKPHPNSYRTLANAYERLNLLADSKRVWESYLDQKPDDLTARKNLDRVEKKIRGDVAIKPNTAPPK